MTIEEIVKQLGLKSLTKYDGNATVSGVFASDLLSDVMANSEEENFWITLQKHPNTIAVAALKDLAGIILVNNRKPDEETLEKAKEEGVAIFSTTMFTFEICGKLYDLLREL